MGSTGHKHSPRALCRDPCRCPALQEGDSGQVSSEWTMRLEVTEGTLEDTLQGEACWGEGSHLWPGLSCPMFESRCCYQRAIPP